MGVADVRDKSLQQVAAAELLVDIVVWNMKCGSKGFPFFFSKVLVPSHREWNSCEPPPRVLTLWSQCVRVCCVSFLRQKSWLHLMDYYHCRS